MTRPAPVAALICGLLAIAAPSAAQQLIGTVVDDNTGRGIEGAVIVLEDRDGVQVGSAVTARNGAFVLLPARPGSARLLISRLGYRSFATEFMVIDPDEEILVRIRMGEDAVPLEPLVVSARSRRHAPDIAAFYQRLERGRRSGVGSFISREDISESQSTRSTDLLRSISGIQISRGRASSGNVIRMRGGCVPAIYIDGAHINRSDPRQSLDEYVTPAAIEGIEIYRGPGVSAIQYHDPGGCGVVLVWTQRGQRDPAGGPIAWRTLAIVGGVLAVLMFLVY